MPAKKSTKKSPSNRRAKTSVPQLSDGRPVGATNRVSRNAKAMLEDAFEELGGLDGLVKWGKRNPDDFYKIWARLLPKNVEHDTGEGLEELLTRLADQRGPEPEEAEFTEVSDAEPPHLVAVGE